MVQYWGGFLQSITHVFARNFNFTVQSLLHTVGYMFPNFLALSI